MSEPLGNLLHRPLASEIRDKWITLFSHPEITLQDLQEQATLPAGLGAEEDDEGGISLRSVYWRLYLGTIPLGCLQAVSTTALRLYLQGERAKYDRLREKWLKAPDGKWAADCTVPEGEGRDRAGRGSADVSSAWDPLNLGEENPWQTWFKNAELRKTIEKDVERTFPDIDYFSDPGVRKILTTILFLWSVENEDVGYRQGMHELLATILLVVDRDSLPSSPSPSNTSSSSTINPLQESQSPTTARLEESMKITLERRYVEHDACALFWNLMTRGKDWYEWRTETVGTVQRRAKIIDICEKMQDELLLKVDPVLHAKLSAEGIEGQLWGIRYVRLLFTREVPFSIAMRLWDGLFAMDPKMDQLVTGICVALLLRVRHLMLASDYAGILTLLLKYPPHSTALPLSPSLLLTQAIRIRDTPHASTGAAISLENQEKLGIPACVPDEQRSPQRGVSGSMRGRQKNSPSSSTARAVGLAPKGYGFESFARGLMDRAQASGLDKAILSTVSELRKNLPEFTPPANTNFPFRNFSPDTTGETAYNNSLPNPEQAFPAPPVRTLLDADREIAELRLIMIGMGKAMGSWLEAVQPASESVPAPNGDQTQLAWQGLTKLQEALLDGGSASTSDLARHWAWSQSLETIAPISIGSGVQPNPALRSSIDGRMNGNGPVPSPVAPSFNVPRLSGTPVTPANCTSFNSPRNSLHAFPSSTSATFSPAPTAGFRNSYPGVGALPAAPAQAAPRPTTQASVHTSPRPPDPQPDAPFEMPKSPNKHENIDLKPAKKADVDPLMGLGV